MALWRKRRFDDYEIDFEVMEEMIGDVLDTFQQEAIDLTKPLKICFSVSLDEEDFLKIDEYGILNEQPLQKKQEEPLVDLIDLGSELVVVVETNNLPAQDIDVKILDHAMVISNTKSRKFIKKIGFPCKVKQDSIKTSYNNNVLEVKLAKRLEVKKTIVKEKR